MLNLIALEVDREGIKGREDGERGAGGGTIRYGQLVNRPVTKNCKFTRGTGNRQLAREIYMKMA